jgi:hypothetical protein
MRGLPRRNGRTTIWLASSQGSRSP